MGESFCADCCDSNIFGAWAVSGVHACHTFPQSLLAIIPLMGVWLVLWRPEPAPDVGWAFLFALWLP